ncbi:tetratricopeptide repeat protein [Chitinophaga pinensis]|uniref:Tetratricopeptide repeat protein n=1 Tax=Chitinophaga pinensis TaxID=79329 RepID=A0A5C6LPU4_9BACT|nr:tetratricopeptide repeat protein [Chitinophaga pinensis]TWV99474.1 tetratricopeptide repeat protein [Chitinophaga pinensis]
MKYLFLLSIPFLICCHSGKQGESVQKNGADSALYAAMVLPLTDSIAQFPENEALYFRRALLLFNTDPVLAQKDFEKAAQLKPAVTDFWAGAGEAALVLEHYPQAIAHFEKALQTAPGYPYLQYRLATALIENKQYAAADSLAGVLSQSTGTYDKAYYLKARIAEENKDTTLAISHLTAAVDHAGLQSDYDAVMELGDLLLTRHSSNTPKYYRLAAKLDSVNAEPYIALGQYYEQTGNTAEAITAYTSSISTDPDDERAYMALGTINVRKKNWKEGLRYFDLAAKTSPNNSEAYYNRAQCLEQLGRKDDAIDDYIKALTFRKEYPEAKAALEKLKK